MKYLGIDFGLRRVGLATSDGELASPLKIIEGKNLKELIKKVLEESMGFDRIVVGMPEGKTGKMVNGFINNLKKHGLEVVEADETLSSREAQSIAVISGVSRKKRKFNDDKAAAIILQNYLDTL
ncbi:hypothetical protein A3C59_04600 [Candidatus Daviesbacteria bacterium RIFCSPHIGHO2_02_FULL_36_13]|uniref:Putative pre-16S rRNA nuclease n=1 Tax=Candidatus Daviesbacteria bacterium RIFCSPHIGHO2_02_FULL_36_13 TaxID=1797768 RepID=A0A1F5JUC7_9BACT|nr:MAG: hypothetical protein A3C59_04600 [Candidatus Daviesbacteria bacterium RIFCSPHIGHO2_02_FULL_36_13]